MSTSSDHAKRTAELSMKIMPILAGQGPDVQSAVLADLVALWIIGHQGGEKKALDAMREELLTNFVALVRELVPVNEAIMRETGAFGTLQ